MRRRRPAVRLPLAGLGRHRLTRELHALSHDRTCVITVQWWTTPAGKKAILVTARDGRTVKVRTGTPDSTGTGWARAVAALTPTSIPEPEARQFLHDRQVPDAWCSRCGELLPIGLWRCQECGKSVARVAAGRIAAARRRGDINIDSGGPPC